jgi:hypothetical protein
MPQVFPFEVINLALKPTLLCGLGKVTAHVINAYPHRGGRLLILITYLSSHICVFFYSLEYTVFLFFMKTLTLSRYADSVFMYV